MASTSISDQTPFMKWGSHSFFGRLHGVFSFKKTKQPTSPPPALCVTSPGRELERVFGYFDEDGDGKISATELRNCLRTVGEEMSPEEAAEVVDSSDSDGDGMLDYEDFVRLVIADEEEERVKTLRLAFAAYEMEGKSCITAESLRRALRRLGEERSVKTCRNMIKRFDVNGDGVICFDEFKLMML